MIVPSKPKMLERMSIGRFPHFREKADTKGTVLPVTNNIYPEMTVISEICLLKPSAIVTKAGDRRGESTEA